MKFNWGHGIAIAVGAFIVMILYFVVDSFNYKPELVASDYYQQEVNYQQQIDKIKNAQDAKIAFDFKPEGFELTYPNAEVTGKVHFFRPSDVALDFIVEIKADKEGKQVIDPAKLKQGRWKAKIDWMYEGKGYYREVDFVMP